MLKSLQATDSLYQILKTVRYIIKWIFKDGSLDTFADKIKKQINFLYVQRK
jgi:hypothetical protein